MICCIQLLTAVVALVDCDFLHHCIADELTFKVTLFVDGSLKKKKTLLLLLCCCVTAVSLKLLGMCLIYPSPLHTYSIYIHILELLPDLVPTALLAFAMTDLNQFQSNLHTAH